MNAAQAKQISLPDLMSRLGYEPVKTLKGGRELWYRSPFRTEGEASFITSYLGGKWIWNDFGDTGGTVIDFVMRHENYTSVKDVLTFLSHMFQGHLFERPYSNRVGAIEEKPMQQEPTLFSFKQQSNFNAPLKVEDSQLEFLSAHAITNPIIHDYLENERKIPVALVDRYLLEITYRNRANNKEYFGFGMKNMSDGYEVRSASSRYSFKSALKGRDITLIQGLAPERKTINVFEGMVDFLSLLVMMNTPNLSGDSLILHSLSSFPKASETIRQQNYQKINTFLDNDRSGQEGTRRFLEEFPGLVTTQSDMFAPHTDLNDALIANPISSLFPRS
jgi:hypothetical protein